MKVVGSSLSCYINFLLKEKDSKPSPISSLVLWYETAIWFELDSLVQWYAIRLQIIRWSNLSCYIVFYLGENDLILSHIHLSCGKIQGFGLLRNRIVLCMVLWSCGMIMDSGKGGWGIKPDLGHFLFNKTRLDTRLTDAATVGQGPQRQLLAYSTALSILWSLKTTTFDNF